MKLRTSNTKKSCRLAEFPGWRHLPTKCGVTRFDEMQRRIIDGKQALLGQFPWMARIGIKGKPESGHPFPSFNCGGALLNRYYVLTAAHCGIEELVRLGENFVNRHVDCDSDICAPPYQDIEIKKQMFRDYVSSVEGNDISLILLESPVEYNDFVLPVCLPRGKILERNFTNSHVSVAGWGHVSNIKKHSSNVLMYAILPIVDAQQCFRYYPFKPIFQYCIGYDKGADTCRGDSGSPVTKSLRVDGVRKTYIIAIVSYGLEKCGHAPAVYTQVIYHLHWILKNIKHS